MADNHSLSYQISSFQVKPHATIRRSDHTDSNADPYADHKRTTLGKLACYKNLIRLKPVTIDK